MKNFKEHPYLSFRREHETHESEHLRMLDHFNHKMSFEVFKKTPQEKAELKKRMQAYPNKNHAPIPPNN